MTDLFIFQNQTMNEAFTWIAEIWNGLTSVIPRAILVKLTHRGVMFTRGKAKVLTPGLHWYLPIWSDPETYPVVEQALEMTTQGLCTLDQRSVTIGCVVIYRVDDIFALLTTVYLPEVTVSESAKGIVKELVAGKTFEELRSGSRTNISLTSRIRTALKDYGIHVIRARMSDFIPTFSLRIYTDGEKITEGYEE